MTLQERWLLGAVLLILTLELSFLKPSPAPVSCWGSSRQGWITRAIPVRITYDARGGCEFDTAVGTHFTCTLCDTRF